MPHISSNMAVKTITAATKAPLAKKKRALSAYIIFANESRGRIKRDNPDASFGQLGKLAGAEWRALSTEDKSEYTAKARDAKENTPPNSQNPSS